MWRAQPAKVGVRPGGPARMSLWLESQAGLTRPGKLVSFYRSEPAPWAGPFSLLLAGAQSPGPSRDLRPRPPGNPVDADLTPASPIFLPFPKVSSHPLSVLLVE